MERIYVYSNISKRFEDQTSSLLERPRLMPDDTYKLVYRANPGRQYSYGSDMVALVREKEAPIEDRFCYWVGNDRYRSYVRLAQGKTGVYQQPGLFATDACHRRAG